jgi:pyruvate,water dikinase
MDALAVARDCAALIEDDDWLYARVQATVRRALVARGLDLEKTRVLSDRSDIFWLPFDLVRRIARGHTVPLDARALARAARAAHDRALADPPPSSSATPPHTMPAGQEAPEGPRQSGAVRGIGVGGRALGRVVMHDPATHNAIPPDAVLVATTFLTELPLLDAAALVSETGGPLDHVAAQARERALPAVVGAARATRVLADGDLVLVDGDAGLVIVVGR